MNRRKGRNERRDGLQEGVLCAVKALRTLMGSWNEINEVLGDERCRNRKE